MNRSSSKRERVSNGKAAMMAGLLFVLPGALGLQATMSPALAVDVFSDWTTAMDGNWEDAGNWTPAQAPANGVDNYFVTITASGSPYIISINSGFNLSDLVLNSPDVTLSFQPGANALNIAPPGGITVTQGTLSFDGGGTFVPYINVDNPSQFVFNSGFVGINGNSQVLLLDGTGLFNDLTLGFNQNLLVQAADSSYTSGINLTTGNTLTIDGGGLWVNLFQQNGGTLVFNQGVLDIDNPFDTFVIGPSGPLAGDFTNSWSRTLRHTGTVQVENGATLTLESGHLQIGALDLSPGGSFVWHSGRLELLSDVIIEDGNSTAPFSNGQSLNQDQYFAIGNDLTIGDTAMGVFFISGWNQSEVQGDLYIGRGAGSDNSQIWVGDPYDFTSGYLYVQGDVYIGGDGVTEGGFADLNIGYYSSFTTDGLLHIHSSSTVNVNNYSALTAGSIVNQGTLILTDAYVHLTNTFQIIVDDNYDFNNGPTESNPFGSSLVIGDFGGGGGGSANLRELSVNNFLSIGDHGGTGSLTVFGDGRLTVGNVLTFGSGAMVDIDMYGWYYYGGGLIEADDVSTFDADPANLRFYNANFRLNMNSSLVIDPSAYQFGEEVYVDGSFQRDDGNGNFIDYNFNYISVPNGQIIVGNTGYGKLVVSNYTQGVETQQMFIGGDDIGADGHVEVSYSNYSYNNDFGESFYQGIRTEGFLLLGAFDIANTHTLDISNSGGVSVGGVLVVGSNTSTNANLTGVLTQSNYSDLTVGGVFTVNEFGKYRGENFGTLAVGSFNVHANADFSVFGIGLIINDSDLTIAAGELFGDTILVDPAGSNSHTEDPAVTLLTRFKLVNGNLNIGASFGKLTVQDPDFYSYYDAHVDVSGTTTIANGAELHILDRGRLRTGSLVVNSGGMFNWEDGYLELTNSDLTIDSVTGSLPIGDNLVIHESDFVNPQRRGLSVSGLLKVAESGDGTLNVRTGYVTAGGGMHIGSGLGGNGTVIVGDSTAFTSAYLTVYGSLDLGGPAGSDADSALLQVNQFGNLQHFGEINLWNDHQIVLNGGTLTANKILKNGNGVDPFAPTNFVYNSGTLILADDNLNVRAGGLLGDDIDLVSGKTLNISSYQVFDPITQQFVYPNGVTTVFNGATLRVSGGNFTTRKLIVQPGGTFELTSGQFYLTDDDLIVDPVTGQLPELVNPGTNIQVTGGKLIVGDGAFGLMDLGTGFISSRGAQFGRNIGSTFTASVGKPDGSAFNNINNNFGGLELVLGGTETAAGGTGTFTVHRNASVNYQFANLRIWNGSRMILDGGTLRVNNILKDDGTASFTHGPTPDFTFNAGNLYLRTDQVLDTTTALGNNLTLGSNKLLDITGKLTIADNASVSLTGGSLLVNELAKVGTGSFSFNSGTLTLRLQHAVVDSIDPSFFLGSNFTFGAGTNISVTNSNFGLIVGFNGTGTATFNGSPNYWQGGNGFFWGPISVGMNPGSNGTLNVGDGTSAGQVSTFNFTYIGDGGIGQLNVLSGGNASLRTTYLARNPGSSATVVVNNATVSTFNTYVGGNGITNGGTASVTLQNGGNWNMFNQTLFMHSQGNVYIQGGSLNTSFIDNQGGRIHFTNGSLTVNRQNLAIGPGEVLGTSVTIPALSTISVGANDIFAGVFTVANGGSLVNHGTLAVRSLNIQQGGTFSGTGTVQRVNFGSVVSVVNAGTIAPGASAGILTINNVSTFTQSGVGTLAIELSGNPNGAPVAGTHYDQLVIAGNLVLDGTLDLIGLPGGHIGNLTDVFQIVRYTGSRTGVFADINWINGFAGVINYDVAVGGGWKAITISQIPEPTTMLLLTLGGTMLLGRRRAS